MILHCNRPKFTTTVRASSVEICLNYTYVRQSTIFQILSPPGIPLKGGLPCAHASTAALAEEKVLYLKNLKYLLGVVSNYIVIAWLS